MRINTLEKWNEVSEKLAAHNFTVWIMQYCVTDPHGFVATFGSTEDGCRIEIVTMNKEIQDSILAFNSKHH